MKRIFFYLTLMIVFSISIYSSISIASSEKGHKIMPWLSLLLEDEQQVDHVDYSSLIINYSFDEGFGNTALDGTGNGSDGIITAASRVDGKFGKGLLFGFDNSYISIDDALHFDEDLITIEAWIKPNEIQEGKTYRIFGEYESSGLDFQIRDGKLEILNEGQSYHYGSTSISPNIWTHIAFTSDGKDIVTYINGVEDARTNITLPLDYIANIRIGVNWIYTGGSSLFDYIEEFPGIIDELRIWNIARSGDEINNTIDRQLFVPQTISISNSSLNASYDFNESSGSTAFDSSGNNHDGTITAASRVGGKLGNGLLFGFDDSYITVDDSLLFENGLITIEAWIKPDKIQEGEVYRILGGYIYYGFYLQVRDGRLEILYEGQSYHYGTKSILPNVWTHIAFTSDGKDIVTFINGIEDSRTNITLPVQDILNIRIGANHIYIGGSPLFDYIEEFPGIIDELRIWSGVRTSDEIFGYFNSTK